MSIDEMSGHGNGASSALYLLEEMNAEVAAMLAAVTVAAKRAYRDC